MSGMHGKVKFDLRESTDALWAIDDHHHATKALITTDQKFQSIESDRLLTCLEVLCLECVKNIDIIPQCEGCLMWRLLYSKHKLSKGVLQVALDDIFMWCSMIITRAKNCVASLVMFTSDVHCYEHICIQTQMSS